MKILSCIKKEKLVKNTGPNELKFLFLNLMQYITGHKGLVLFFFFQFLFLLYFTLQYCIGFAIHWHETTTGLGRKDNLKERKKVKSLSRVWLFVTLWTVAYNLKKG